MNHNHLCTNCVQCIGDIQPYGFFRTVCSKYKIHIIQSQIISGLSIVCEDTRYVMFNVVHRSFLDNQLKICKDTRDIIQSQISWTICYRYQIHIDEGICLHCTNPGCDLYHSKLREGYFVSLISGNYRDESLDSILCPVRAMSGTPTQTWLQHNGGWLWGQI